MNFVPWSQPHAVACGPLDAEQQAVLECVGALREIFDRKDGAAAFNAGLRALLAALADHFDRQEEVMRRSAYTYLPAHKEQHRLLTRDVHAVRKLLSAQPDAVDLARVVAFVETWWQDHLARSDMAFASFVRGACDPSSRAAAPEPVPAALPPGVDRAEEALRAVTVQVPSDRLDAIYTCARLLRRGGPEAEAIAEIADPLATMTVDEAAIIARGLMR